MTVYVYPASGGTCRDWFESADEAVTKGGDAARADDRIPLALLPLDLEQFTARYRVAASTDGAEPEMVSYLYVGCVPDAQGQRWAVKYRGSFLAEDADKAVALSRRLFAIIDWSALLGE